MPELPYLRAIWVVGGSERSWVTPVAFDAVDDTGLSDELLAAVESEVSPADPAVVVYTSGSAAEPKAVVHTHGTVVRKTSTGSMVGLPGSYPGQRVLCAMPFFWVGGVQMLAGALHSGSAIVCQERFDAVGGARPHRTRARDDDARVGHHALGDQRRLRRRHAAI